MRKLVLLVVMGIMAVAAHAQTTPAKIGTADVDYIFSKMPESKQIEAELKSLETQLKNQIDAKIKDFQKKVTDYNNNLNTMIDAVRVNTERELKQTQENIEKFQQDAQQSIQNKHNSLMAPVYEKVGKAIEATAKENGYTAILNQQIGGLDVVLYGDENLDISDLVLKKLGVTP
jgi:outer membrane protein